MRSGGYSPACDDDRRWPHPRQSKGHRERSMDFRSDARWKPGCRGICDFVEERSWSHSRRGSPVTDSRDFGFRLDVCCRRALHDNRGDDCSFPATIPGKSIAAVTQDWRRSRQVCQPARAESLGSNDEVLWTAFSSHTPRSANHSRTHGNYYLENDFNFGYFDGDSQIDAYMEWEQEIERSFDYLGITQEEQVCFVVSKLIGRAKVWWKLMKRARRIEGRRDIQKWSKMKKLLRSQFLWTDNDELLYSQCEIHSQSSDKSHTHVKQSRGLVRKKYVAKEKSERIFGTHVDESFEYIYLLLQNFKDFKSSPIEFASIVPAEKFRKLLSNESKIENNEENISDSDVDNIVGIGDSLGLEEMDPPKTLLCELRSHQRQALHWMLRLEKRGCLEEAARTLHPCWDAYHLADKRDLVMCVNAFSGDATIEFPSTQQILRGGILADAMGLGKTIMTLALLLAHSEKGRSSTYSSIQSSNEDNNTLESFDKLSSASQTSASISGFNKLLKSKSIFVGGGNLIVCPMTLLGQWKAEIETHAQQGSLSLYVHYGPSRPKEVRIFAQSDIVMTTYGVLVSEFSVENAKDNGGLYSVQWFRIVLDEAHTIKSSKSQVSISAAALTFDRRWCLTWTPIQNNLDDLYDLLHFLLVEPYGNWAMWNKLIQKPYECCEHHFLVMSHGDTKEFADLNKFAKVSWPE